MTAIKEAETVILRYYHSGDLGVENPEAEYKWSVDPEARGKATEWSGQPYTQESTNFLRPMGDYTKR